MIDTIMIFAAGKGTRMYPLTSNTPKPLINILNKPILYWVLDLICSSYKFKKIIINTHYLAHKIEEAINNYTKENENTPEIIISYEEELLETGGGLKKILSYVNSDLIYTINSDSIIIPNNNFFVDMENFWDGRQMDMMMLLYPTEKAIGYKGKGDCFRDKNGRIYGINTDVIKPYMNTGIHIIKKTIIEEQLETIFSIKKFYTSKNYENRIFSFLGDGHWVHATYSEDIPTIERYLISLGYSY